MSDLNNDFSMLIIALLGKGQGMCAQVTGK